LALRVHFLAAQRSGRLRSEADIPRDAYKAGFMSTRPSHLELKFISL
jgi:hypothetical protein